MFLRVLQYRVSSLKQQAAQSCTQVGGRGGDLQHNINIIQSFWEAFLSCRWNCSLESLPAHCFPTTTSLRLFFSTLFLSLSLFFSLSLPSFEQVLICQDYNSAVLRFLVGRGSLWEPNSSCHLIGSSVMCRRLNLSLFWLV